MAGIVELILQAKDRASQSINRVRGSFLKLGKSVDKVQHISSGMLDFGVKIGVMGAAMSAALAIPIKTAADFEQAMALVKAVSGATDEEFAKLTNTARELGRTTKFSASEAADGMNFLAMAGFKSTEIIAAMPSVLELAAAANLDLASAADITSNILTGYGMKVEDLAKVNDVLVGTFTSANTDLTQLGIAMKYVGPVASSAGISFTEVAAAIGLLGNAGIQGSMAGTSLRKTISSLIKPSSAGAKELQKLGVSVVDSKGKFIGLANILKQMNKGLGSVGGEAERTSIIMKIFGERAGPGMAALLDAGASALDNLNQKLKNTGGLANKIATEQLATLEGAFTKLKSAISGFLISVGQPFLKPISALAEALARLVTKVTEVKEALGPLGTIVFGTIGLLGGLLLVAGGVSIAIGAIGFVLAGVIRGFEAWADLLPIVRKGIRAVMSLDLIGYLTSFIASLKSLRFALLGAAAGTTALGLAIKATLIGAAIWAVVEVGKLIARYINWRKESKKLAEIHKELADQTAYLESRTEKYNQKLKELGFKTMKEFNKAVKEGTVRFNEQTKAWERVTKAAKDQKKTYEDLIDSLKEGSAKYIAIKTQELKTRKAQIDYEMALEKQKYSNGEISLQGFLQNRRQLLESYLQDVVALKEMELDELKKNPEGNLKKIKAIEEGIKQIKLQSAQEQLNIQQALTQGLKKEHEDSFNNWKALQQLKLQSLKSQLDLEDAIDTAAADKGLIRQSELLQGRLERLKRYNAAAIEAITERIRKAAEIEGTENIKYQKLYSERERMQRDLQVKIIQSEASITEAQIREEQEAQKFIAELTGDRIKLAQLESDEKLKILKKYYEEGLITASEYSDSLKVIEENTTDTFSAELHERSQQLTQWAGIISTRIKKMWDAVSRSEEHTSELQSH